MFARVSAYELPQERTADAVAAFRTAIADMEGLSGLLDAYMLLSEDGSSALTVTLWETHDAMTASRVRAARVRSAAAEAADSAVQSTIEYRVAVHGRGSGTAGDSTTASLAAAVPPPS